MHAHPRLLRFTVLLVVLNLVFNSVAPALLAQDGTPLFLPWITNGIAPATDPTTTDLLLRTRVRVQTPAQWRDLDRLGVVTLAKGDDWAQLLVDDQQLATLARWRYNPEVTDSLATLAGADPALAAGFATLLQLEAEISGQLAQASAVDAAAQHAELRMLMQAVSAQQIEILAQAASVDTDGDGLSDDQEGWWCTDPAKADTDFDGRSDGTEINALKAWMNNERVAPPGGTPWTDWLFGATCPDKDFDSVPNLAETLDLGLNSDLESTDRDQFDDGQELFGTTRCPGSGAACGYGSLPPANTANLVLFPEMPGWVRAPGNHPLAAGLPLIKIDVDNANLKVTTVTEVTTDRVITSGTEKSYSTAKTEGTSTSVADTETWNEWQEVAESYERIAPNLASASDASSVDLVKQTNVDGVGLTTGALGIVGGGLGIAAACAATAGIACVLGAAAGGVAILAGGIQSLDALNQDDVPSQNVYQSTNVRLENNIDVENEVQVVLNQSFDTSNIVHALEGNRLAYFQSGQVLSQHLYELTSVMAAPRFTSTSSKGSSVGGSQTTTHEQYQEHTVTNGEAFSTSESWGNATAVNSAHAADLRFSYTLRNIGTDFARHVCEIAFNLYIGDDPNSAYTYDIAPDLGGDGCLSNIQPSLTGGIARTSRPVPLSLEQMRLIDLGAPIRIVVSRYVLSTEDYYAADAASKGVLLALEDGTADGDETIDTYLIPTWGEETVLQVLTRYFPHDTDADGTLIAIWTPEYRSDTPSWCQSPRRPTDQPSKAVWCRHALSTADWWNVYTDGLGDGSEGFQDTQAAPGAVALFRFNQDSDLDGFSDRSERQLGTDVNDAASFPHPEVLAGLHSVTSGNKVVATLSLLNTGLYDAYGVEAVMVAPDDSVSITNNTVGGSGRVRAQKQVIVGSRSVVQNLTNTPWTQANHATPGVGGYYTGSSDRTYTFTVNCANPGGCKVGEGAWTVGWNDGQGGSGSLNFGAGYPSPTFLTVGNLGISLALYSGNVSHSESFTVAANTPRDTFQYTINREPHTPPLVIVSYNDPQGNHRFVIPPTAMALDAPTTNLQQFAGAMLEDVGVELVTNAAFAAGGNSVNLLVNNPSDKMLTNANLFLELINISGTVVLEVPTQVTLPPGPKTTTVNFSTNDFNPPFNANQDYIVMAFLTDYQGNILDTAGRPLSSFQVDPLPTLVADDASLTWNFGTVAQGTLLKHGLALANTGFGRLYTYVPPATGLSLSNGGGQTVGAADISPYELTLRTADLPVGAYDKTITIATSDPDNPARTLHVLGTITAPAGDTPGGALVRPLDVPVTVAGSHSLGEWYEFTHGLGPDPQSLQPVKVYSQDYATLWGVGKYATDFGQGTASAEMFGDGRDGVMPGSGNLDYAQGFGVGIVNSGSIGSTSINVADAYILARINPGDVVLIHQTQGGGAGCWELNKAISDFDGNAGTYQLSKPLQCNYSTSGNNHAQILRVPQYSTCNVTGTVTPLASWNGTWGGIFAIKCRDGINITGRIDASGSGFIGGTSSYGFAPGNGQHGKQGEGIVGPGGGATKTANSNGGGGGQGNEGGDGGGGGGNGTNGTAGGTRFTVTDGGQGGIVSSSESLTSMTLGGGGGSGGGEANANSSSVSGSGGRGGGIVVIDAAILGISGDIYANGASGGNATKVEEGSGGGGGGAGGSIIIRLQQAPLGSNKAIALGGTGGAKGNSAGGAGNGGTGGDGRIRIEYCESLTGTTNPPASTQKLDCYITEQIETAPYTSARLNLPEAVNSSATYNVQFGRKLDFAAPGNQLTSLRLPAGMAGSVKLDVLVSGLAADSPLSLDVGDDGSVEWSGSVANNSTNTSPELAEAFNAYWASHGAPASGTIDVPVRVSIGGAAQLLLTNLQLLSSASRVRHVRLPVQTYTQFLLDFTAGGSGSVVAALDVGDNGSIDWSTPAAGVAPMRWQTGDLKTALNAYLAGKSGEQTVPIRIYVAPSGTVTLNDYTATYTPQTDLTADSITVGAAVAAASTEATSYHEGDQLTVQASLRNPSNTASGPVTAAFFANAPGWGDWYIGSAFVDNIVAGGSVAVSVPWNTTGFGSDVAVPVKVVVNPYGRLNETNIANNSKSVNITVTPPQVAQTITFAALPDKMIADPDFALVASAAPSGLPISFSSMTSSVCTVSGNMVKLLTTGTCTIQATQAGNAFFLAAPPLTQSFAVKSSTKLEQIITFSALPNKTLGDPPFTLSATTESGLPVSFSAQTSSVCTINGNTVTLVATGTCSIQAIQNGDVTYNPATPVTQSFTVGQKNNQTITFSELSSKTLDASPFDLSATASSGLPLSFTSQTPAVCTVNGNTVTLVAVGECIIRAAQAGNIAYNAAPDVARSFQVTLGPVSQTISFGELSGTTLANASFSLSASATSGLAVSFSSLTPTVCGVDNNTVTLLAVGVCTLRAAQPGNANYLPAPTVDRSFAVSKAEQTITFGALLDQTLGNVPFTLNATASSGLPVSFATLTPAICTLSGNTITLITNGACSLVATQDGNAVYNAAPAVTQSFTVTSVISPTQKIFLPLVRR